MDTSEMAMVVEEEEEEEHIQLPVSPIRPNTRSRTKRGKDGAEVTTYPLPLIPTSSSSLSVSQNATRTCKIVTRARLALSTRAASTD